jgi:hypothetical protein
MRNEAKLSKNVGQGPGAKEPKWGMTKQTQLGRTPPRTIRCETKPNCLRTGVRGPERQGAESKNDETNPIPAPRSPAPGATR